jgi:hypothetical protein
VLGLRQDHVLHLRGEEHECVLGSDPTNGYIQVFEELIRDTRGNFGP